nr:zinc-binding dehydrogenase [Actinopolyspora mortivallis]
MHHLVRTLRLLPEGTYSQCLGGGGWKLGNAVHGTQAEYVRVPFADTSTHVLPDEAANNEAILVSDVYPTAYETGVLNGGVSPGDTVVIVGPGPIGLAALGAARLYSAGRIIVVGRSAPRLEVARRLGADAAVSHTENPEQLVREITRSRGADVVIEAVGSAETFELCTRLVRPAGRIASIGVYGEPATLHLEELWNRNITITTGLVNTHSTPRLLSLLTAGLLPVSELATHTFALPDIMEAYDTFDKASENRAMKVLLNNPE